jgi:uncharacterized protein YkwD
MSITNFINNNIFDISSVTNHINFYRYNHYAPNLRYNETLELFSQKWCDNLFKNDLFEHSNNPLYGENLYFSMNSVFSFANTSNILTAIDDWYSEINNYDYNKNGNQPNTGHATALLWKNSQKFSIGYSSDGYKTYICMNIWPPGNIENNYKKNVLPPN